MSQSDPYSQHHQGEYWPLGHRVKMLINAVEKRLSSVPNQSSVKNRYQNSFHSLKHLFDSYDLDYVDGNMHLMADRFARYTARLDAELTQGGPQSIQNRANGFSNHLSLGRAAAAASDDLRGILGDLNYSGGKKKRKYCLTCKGRCKHIYNKPKNELI